MENSMLKLLASKLNISSPGVIKKAGELFRLLQLKTASGCRNFAMSETCRTVICLDLASGLLEVIVEKEDVIRLSGVKKKIYINYFHTVEKLLELDKQLSVRDVCVQLGCSEISSFAQKLLNSYESEHGASPREAQTLDLSHPMYCAVAVYTTCRHHKLKVDRAKLIEQSRLKKSEFDNLATRFNKTIEKLYPKNKKLGQKRTQNLMDIVDSRIKQTEMEEALKQKTSDKTYAEKMESYEVWKKRMLQENATDDS